MLPSRFVKCVGDRGDPQLSSPLYNGVQERMVLLIVPVFAPYIFSSFLSSSRLGKLAT